MKFFAVFLLAASAGFAAEFTTGQAARLVIGQTTFTAQEQGASDTLLGGVGGVAYAQDTLFVTDASRLSADPINHRVLIFKSLSTMLPAPTDELEYTQTCPVCGGAASLVLGQPDFTETAYSTPPTQDTLRTPTAVATDGVRLAIADTDNNRVLIWNSFPSSNKAPPDVVVGQPDFKVSAVANPPNAGSLRGPQGVWIQNGRLFVADTSNNRILIWNSIPAVERQSCGCGVGPAAFWRRGSIGHHPGLAEPSAHDTGKPRLGDLRRAAALRHRPRPEPHSHLEFDSRRKPAAGGCRRRPAGHDQRRLQLHVQAVPGYQ